MGHGSLDVPDAERSGDASTAQFAPHAMQELSASLLATDCTAKKAAAAVASAMHRAVAAAQIMVGLFRT